MRYLILIRHGAYEADGHGGFRLSSNGKKQIEKLEDIVTLQVEAIKNIKIDKITVWDSGNSRGGAKTDNGSTTSNFISQFVNSLPALHDVASMAGLELPQFLGQMKEKTVKKDEVIKVK